jgi:hypothetical protein
MIITDPAALIIRETFGRHLSPLVRLRAAAPVPGKSHSIGTQGYAEAGFVPVTNQSGTPAPPQHSAMQRRETPL